jgi:hypothetical protein
MSTLAWSPFLLQSRFKNPKSAQLIERNISNIITEDDVLAFQIRGQVIG